MKSSGIEFAYFTMILLALIGCSGQDHRKQVDAEGIHDSINEIQPEAINRVDVDADTIQADERIDTIRSFYKLHEAIWSIPPADISPDLFNSKLDSLAAKYCTRSLRARAMEYLVEGHDLFTGDWTIKISTMQVARELGKENSFVVSFEIDMQRDPPNDPEKKDTKLRVQLVKELDGYKLDSVIEIEK